MQISETDAFSVKEIITKYLNLMYMLFIIDKFIYIYTSIYSHVLQYICIYTINWRLCLISTSSSYKHIPSVKKEIRIY